MLNGLNIHRKCYSPRASFLVTPHKVRGLIRLRWAQDIHGAVFSQMNKVAVLIGQKPCAVTLALLGVRPVILSSKQSGKLDLGAFLSQAFSIKGKGRWVVSSRLTWEVLQSECFSSYMSGTFFPIGYSSLWLQVTTSLAGCKAGTGRIQAPNFWPRTACNVLKFWSLVH